MKRFWKDLKGHYKYAFYAAKSQLKSEVADSYLNWIWWVLEPFCFMLIYSFVFGSLFNAKEDYFSLFIFTGITFWDFFNRNLTQSVKCIKTNKSIVTKVYIPKFILLITQMILNAYKMVFSLIIILIMLVYFRVPITYNIIFIIPIFMVEVIFTFGIMTHLEHYGVFLQDLTNIVTIALRMMYYLTGIFFNIEKRLGGQMGQLMVKLNPMGLIISSMRKCLIYGQTPDFAWLLCWAVFGMIIAVFGIRKVYKNENNYVKVI